MKKKFKKRKGKLEKLIPFKVRFVSLSLFLFMLGWGLGTDTYFSLYIKNIIGNSRGVTAIGTILALSKLSMVIPIGKMNDHINIKYILLIGKILYATCGIFFFLAGILNSWILLLIAAVLNGFAHASTFTSYRSYYGKSATKSDNASVFGAYFSAQNLAEVVGALIAAVLVRHLDLPYMYMFVTIFALVSLIQDQKIKSEISIHYNKSRKKASKRLDCKTDSGGELKFLGKDGFLRQFIKESTSPDSWHEIRAILHKYPKNLYIALLSQYLSNFLNYVGFLFIPIISAEHNLSLSQIAIIFAIMKLPYVINVFIGKFGDRVSKKLLISGIMIIMSFLYIAMGFASGFMTILTLTFFISLGIALLLPLTSALVSSYTHPKDKGAMSGVQDFASRLGDITGALGFGTLSSIIGLSNGFIVIGLCTLGLSGYLFVSKLISRRRKRLEREPEGTMEQYRLQIPVIDIKPGEKIQ